RPTDVLGAVRATAACCNSLWLSLRLTTFAALGASEQKTHWNLPSSFDERVSWYSIRRGGGVSSAPGSGVFPGRSGQLIESMGGLMTDRTFTRDAEELGGISSL